MAAHIKVLVNNVFLSQRKVVTERSLTLQSRALLNNFIKNYSSDTPDVQTGKSEDIDNFEQELEVEVDEMEKKRNVSRLYETHRRMLHGELPFTEQYLPFHKTIKYRRKLYARYGAASGVNPGIMWPTKEDLVKMREYDSVAHSSEEGGTPPQTSETVHRMMDVVKEKKEKEHARLKAREEEIEKNMKQLDKWIKEIEVKKERKLAAEQQAKEKRDRLIEEVREFLGYQIDYRDARFQQALADKEKAEEKAAKEAKKQLKKEKTIARLQEIVSAAAQHKTE